MRRSTSLAVLLCAAAILVIGAAGFALAQGSDGAGRAPGATLEMAVKSRLTSGASATSIARTSSAPPSQTMQPAPVGTVAVVTVPDLPITEPSTAPAVPMDPQPAQEPAPTAAAPPPAPEAAPPPAAPAPSPAAPAQPPADTPVAPPYSAVLGWTGEGRVAYLTFDDGPGPYTGRILDILAANGAKATFCEVGMKVTENAGLARRVVAEGHTLCNHSWDHHSPFDALPPETLDQQIGLTQNVITSATGVTPRYFRAPEGRFGNPGGAVLQAGQRARTIPLGWAVDSRDWTKPGMPTIVANVVNAVTPGAVILLHDGGGTDRDQTIEALPGIIAGLRAAGYSLAALPPDPVG